MNSIFVQISLSLMGFSTGILILAFYYMARHEDIEMVRFAVLLSIAFSALAIAFRLA